MNKRIAASIIGGGILLGGIGGYLVAGRKPLVVAERIVTVDREVVTRTSGYVGVNKTTEKSRVEYKTVTRWTKGGDVVQTKEVEVVKEKEAASQVKEEVKETREVDKKTERAITYSKPNWSVAGAYGLDRSYSLEVDRRILGSVFVGVRGVRTLGAGYTGAVVLRVEW